MRKIKTALAVLMSASLLLAGCTHKETTKVEDIDLSSYPIKTDVTLTYWRNLPTNFPV